MTSPRRRLRLIRSRLHASSFPEDDRTGLLGLAALDRDWSWIEEFAPMLFSRVELPCSLLAGGAC